MQILLPLYQARGRRQPRARFELTRRELTAKFGGLTSYARAPAKGFWKKRAGTERDDIVVLEVMTARLEARWWRRYRRTLETRFKQEEIVVRSLTFRRL